MPKRRAPSVTSDDAAESSEGSQVSKRARTDSSEQEAPGPSTSRRNPRGTRSKSHREPTADADMEDDEEIEQDALDEEEEARYEKQHEGKLRKTLEEKKQSQIEGGVAEMGIIETLEMHHFMCHRFLTFSFGPQINFIIGHNGSGKSAVLSALTVALGGKATSTGRGSGLKSFICEGESVSEVTVTLKNQGEEAYKPREYGSSIAITRRFTKEGSSSYKIRSKDGRVISTKREELAAICDHMNIQVDNPMNILTQDAARQFLSASQPADKYKFFLRGTQLSQLSEEYQTCLENIATTTKVLKAKAEAIPDLRDQLEEATARFQEAHKAREQRHKADELKRELAWAHVAFKEGQLKTAVEAATKAGSRLPKVKESIAKADAEIDKASQEVEDAEAELTAMGEIEDLRNGKKNLQDQIKENKKKIAEFVEEQRQMNQNLANTKKQIALLDEQITREQAKLEADNQGKRDEINRKLEQANSDLDECAARLHAVRTERAQKAAEQQTAQAELARLGGEVEGKRNLIVQAQSQLQRCAEREKNKLAPYGRNMDRVMAEIERTRWHGNRPVGPLGLYVSVREPQAWAPLMRVQLGGLMSAFAVTDTRDRPILEKLLKHFENSPMIIIAEVDLFDYSRGEPPEEVPTVLRALDITDPYVLRVLINSAHIESTVIARSRAEADQILRRLGRGLAVSADFYRVQRFAEGGGSSNPVNSLRPGDPRQQLFTGNDPAQERRRWEGEVQRAEEDYRNATQTLKQLQSRVEQLNREIRQLGDQESRLAHQERQLKVHRDGLIVESNDDAPAQMQALISAKEEQETERKMIASQFAVVEKNKAELDLKQRPLVEKHAQIQRQIGDYEGQRSVFRQRIQAAAEARLTAQHAKEHYKKKLDEEEKKVQDAQTIVKDTETEFTAWTEKAEEYCARFPNPRGVEEVQRNLKAVQDALKEREKRQGASVEDMTIEVNRRKAALDSAKRDLKNMIALNRALKKSIRIRLTRWHEFRRHIALRCKVYFQYHLSHRGYYGKVLFDHVNGTLQLKVKTDDQRLTQGSREKDPRSLSGGEKSFSTICLLLSLWESIGCPIRCLDEFDVFMDAVNRRISMRMMIDTAKASDRKQYVLITPQDMTSIQIDHTVRVHRMSDPERGQGVLAFS